MFASVFSQLPARLRRALTLIKAFAFLEDPPAALPALAPAAAVSLREPSPACDGDRRRGTGAVRTPRPGTMIERCSTTRSSAGRSGRPLAPAQRCATPATSSKRTGQPVAAQDRRASVAGGFLHR